MDTIRSIREQFALIYKQGLFIPDKSGQKVVEILGAQFIADEDTIFGAPNAKYIAREIAWYMSKSLSIDDMEPPIPLIWQSVASHAGKVNSNYGYLIFSSENHHQLLNCLRELRDNCWSRRAVMIYTRPSMWYEYSAQGMSDFICTNVVQYFIRSSPNDKTEELRLFAKVDMRSNDAWAGYRNDYAWQRYIFEHMHKELLKFYPNLLRGAIIWNCGSLHIYERNFDLIQHYIDTGEHSPHPEKLLFTRRRLVKEGIIGQ